MAKTAILVDGGFYRKRAFYFWGDIGADARAEELRHYCMDHINRRKGEIRELYRIFYYDCPAIKKKVYHPLLKKTIDFGGGDTYRWMESFLKALSSKRKFALRLGTIDAERAHYNLCFDTTKKLVSGSVMPDALTKNDFCLCDFTQKGVDMKIGIDIATIAYNKLADQIILIAGDSDFVPAAKLARVQGIDFILDNMRNPIKESLFEHIDGIQTFCPKEKVPADEKKIAKESGKLPDDE